MICSRPALARSQEFSLHEAETPCQLEAGLAYALAGRFEVDKKEHSQMSTSLQLDGRGHEMS